VLEQKQPQEQQLLLLLVLLLGVVFCLVEGQGCCCLGQGGVGLPPPLLPACCHLPYQWGYWQGYCCSRQHPCQMQCLHHQGQQVCYCLELTEPWDAAVVVPLLLVV
jgi:hypothetical protein